MTEHSTTNERSNPLRPSYSRNNRSLASSLISYVKVSILLLVYFWLLLFGISDNEWSTTISNNKQQPTSSEIIEDLRGYTKLQHIQQTILKNEQERIQKRKDDIKRERERLEKERQNKERLMKQIQNKSNIAMADLISSALGSKTIFNFGKNTTKKGLVSMRNIGNNKNATTLLRKQPKYHGRSVLTQQKHRNAKSAPVYDPTFPLFVLFSLFAIMRICTTLCIRIFIPDEYDTLTATLRQQRQQRDGDGDSNDEDNTDLSLGRFLLTRRGAGPFLRRRRGADAPGSRRARYNALVERLNRTRVENGERPISAESLRLVLSTRDFNGDDYEHLLQFNEENGPAMNAFLSSIGATPAEIERLPSHVIEAGDDLLCRSSLQSIPEGDSTQTHNRHFCSICLEGYELDQTVRTIPCFHTFHSTCIDRWLSQKAECPICKFPAIG